MRKISLEINNSIYEYIMFFLGNIPKNLLNIKGELQPNGQQKKSNNSFNPRDFFGIANSSKTEIDYYLKRSKNEWNEHSNEQ